MFAVVGWLNPIAKRDKTTVPAGESAVAVR